MDEEMYLVWIIDLLSTIIINILIDFLLIKIVKVRSDCAKRIAITISVTLCALNFVIIANFGNSSAINFIPYIVWYYINHSIITKHGVSEIQEENETLEKQYCEYCGNKIEGEGYFCTKCGKKLNKETNNKKSSQGIILITAILCFVIWILINLPLGYFLYEYLY